MEINFIYKAPRYKSAHINDPRYFNCLSYYLPPTESKRDAFVSYDQIIKNPKAVNKQIARARAGKKIYSNSTLKLMAKFNAMGYSFNEITQPIKPLTESISNNVKTFNDNVKTSFKDKFMPEEPNPYANRSYEVKLDKQSNPYAVSNSEKLKKLFDRASSLIEEVKDKLQNESEETKPSFKERLNSSKENMSELGKRIRARLTPQQTDIIVDDDNATTEDAKQTVRQKLHAVVNNLEDLGERLRLKLMYPEAREQYLQNKAKEELSNDNAANENDDINSSEIKERSTKSFGLKTFPGSFPIPADKTNKTENTIQNVDDEIKDNTTLDINDIDNIEDNNDFYENNNTENHIEVNNQEPIETTEDNKIDDTENETSFVTNNSSRRSVVQIISTKLTNASDNLKNHYINAKDYFSKDFKGTKIYQYYDSFKDKCKRSIHSLSSHIFTKKVENEEDYSKYGKKESRIRVEETDLSK